MQENLSLIPSQSDPESLLPQFKDGHHSAVFAQVTQGLDAAGRRFRSTWASNLLKTGFLQTLMDAHWSGATLLRTVTAEGPDQKYSVAHEGFTEDDFGQPVDVFKIVELTEPIPVPHVESMRLATLRQPLSRFVQPVGISLSFSNANIARVDLHFISDQIARAQIVGGASNTLFPTTRPNPNGQYICFGLDVIGGIKTLTVEAGYEHEPAPNHTYVNIEGEPLSSNGMRVRGDYVEFFDVDKKSGEINGSRPVWLPGVIQRLMGAPPSPGY